MSFSEAEALEDPRAPVKQRPARLYLFLTLHEELIYKVEEFVFCSNSITFDSAGLSRTTMGVKKRSPW